MLFQGLVDTVLFHVNALTGEDALEKSPAGTVLQGVDLISGPLLEAYQLPGNSKAVVLLNEFLQVRINLPEAAHLLLNPPIGIRLS